jgi:hypothetical protein
MPSACLGKVIGKDVIDSLSMLSWTKETQMLLRQPQHA